jgi:excisionase family DNA binding protein
MPTTPDQTDRPRKVSIRQAALEFGVDERYMRRLIDQLGIGYYRLGPKMYRIDLDELYAALRVGGDVVA